MTAPTMTLCSLDLRPLREYRPSVIGARAAELARRLAVPREAVRLAAGWTLSLTSQPDDDSWESSGPPLEIEVRIGGETAHLRTVRPVVERLLHDAEPRLEADDLDEELCAGLIESHLVEAVERLEAELGVDCAFCRIGGVRDWEHYARLDMVLTMEGERTGYPIALFGTPRLLGSLASVWERRPVRAQSAIVPTYSLAARVAYSGLSRKALQHLSVGDGLMFDRVAPDGGVVLCVADHLFACAQITEEGDVRLEEPFSAAGPLSLGEFSMLENNEENTGAAALDDASLGSLPVHLVFEIGRREVSLEELRELGVGAPIPLDRPASESVDIIANGRRVGAGEMVLIGDQLGVRITRLNGHA